MENEFDRIFDECIDRLNEGQHIDDVLRLYPDHAEALAPLLKAVSGLQEQTAFIPSEKAKAEGKQKLLRARYELGQQRSAAKIPLIQRLFGQPKLWAPIAAVLLMFVIGLAVVALFDSSNGEPEEIVAIPGTSETPATSTAPTASTIPTTSGTTTPPTTTTGTSPTTPGDIVVADAGFLEIRVHDKPNDEIAEAWFTLSRIEVHLAQSGGGQGSADDGSWEMVIEESRTFELLHLRDGIEEALGGSDLPVGHYTQIRLDIEQVELISESGEKRLAKLPSGELKLVGGFDIEAGETTILTLDFDATALPNAIPSQNKDIIYRPVVKMTVTKGQQQSAPTE